MKRAMIRWCLGALWLGWSMSASASGLEQLQNFLTHTREAEAHFVQITEGANGKKQPPASGVFQFSRPGKFRWDYQKPYAQTIVGDGKYLWIWDPDLRQATRKKLTESLGSTPAALLAGDNTLEQGFRLTEDGESDGLQWVLALPKSVDSGFERIRLGFGPEFLVRMELKDNFGHTITIRFDQINKMPHFSASHFHFVPPAGADVIQ